MARVLEIPRGALVLLVGASGAGKSTFARAHFAPPLIGKAKAHGAALVAIVFDVDAATCIARNDARGDRPNSRVYVMRQRANLERSLEELPSEGFAAVHALTASSIDDVVVRRA